MLPLLLRVSYSSMHMPTSSLASIHQALRKDGRVILVDFRREEGVSAEWIVKHVRAVFVENQP